MNKIRRTSTFFKLLFQMAFIALLLVNVIGWIYAPEPIVLLEGGIRLNVIPDIYAGTHEHSSAILHILSMSEKALGFLVSLIPVGIKLFILYSLIRLFKLYEQGHIFSEKHVRYIRHIGYSLLLSQIITPIYQGLMGLVLTWRNPPGERLVSMSFDQSNLGIMFMAFMIIFISWIMAEGCKLGKQST